MTKIEIQTIIFIVFIGIIFVCVFGVIAFMNNSLLAFLLMLVLYMCCVGAVIGVFIGSHYIANYIIKKRGDK